MRSGLHSAGKHANSSAKTCVGDVFKLKEEGFQELCLSLSLLPQSNQGPGQGRVSIYIIGHSYRSPQEPLYILLYEKMVFAKG